MHTAYSQQSASYVNKFEHIQGDRAGALAQVGGWAPVQGWGLGPCTGWPGPCTGGQGFVQASPHSERKNGNTDRHD